MRSIRLKLSALCAALLLLFGGTLAHAAPTATPSPTLPPFDASVPRYDQDHPEALTPDQIYAQSFILINQEDGRVLMEKNADVRMNPASITKIMTLLLAVEYHAGALNEVITVPRAAEDIPKDSSVVPITVGEEMTFTDLLYGMMLRSGNDAANAVAVLVGGSIDGFVDMMNDRAKELGCTGTHFVNPHGYTADGHYTTARDLAIITRAAMQNATVRRIVGTGQYTMSPTNLRGEYIIQNSNLLVVYGSEFRYSGATGVKTGTTSAAGQCLVSAADKNGVKLICVALKSTTAFVNAKWQDAKRLLNYGFAQYRTYTFAELYDMLNLTVPISGASEDDASGSVIRLNALINRAGSYEATIHVDNLGDLLQSFRDSLTIEYTHDFTAPLDVGTVMGRLTFTPPEGDVITAVLVSDRAVNAAPAARVSGIGSLLERVPKWVYFALAFLLLFLLILIVARIVSAIRRARRRAQARKRARERARQRAARARAQRRRPKYRA
ncbi:MAG: D-alanyl-D-alanine carboxypeptidase [Clostridia bacterium]|nr:D-alanyl-D-alanine carboxypeptidase [Clostridia bacterium]